MTKYDLKDGMVVENGEGNRYLVLNGKLMREGTYYSVDSLNDDLTCNGIFSELSIIKVFKSSAVTLGDMFNDNNLNLIWTRKKAIEVGSIVKVIRSGERYTLYAGFFKNNNIDVDICLRYRYDDNDKFNDSDKFKVLKIIEDYVIIEKQSLNKPVYLFNLRGLEVVE